VCLFPGGFDLRALCSLESTYEAVRTFQILGLENYKSLSGKACKFAAENLASPGSTTKDLFHAVRISGALGCAVDAGVYDVGASFSGLDVATCTVMIDAVLSIVHFGRVLWRGSRQ
jgi:hypothetical protein